MNTLHEVWDAMMRNKMRVTATGIAVASGIFLLIVLLGAGNGIIHTLEQNSEGLNLDAINIWPGTTSKPWNGLKEGRSIQLKDEDRKALIKQHSDAVLSGSAQLDKTETANVGHKHLTVSLMGVFPSYTEFENIQILRGRFLNQIDMRERRRVVVIDEKAEASLFGKNTNAVGRDVRVGQSMFRIVGVQKNDFAFSNIVPIDDIIVTGIVTTVTARIIIEIVIRSIAEFYCVRRTIAGSRRGHGNGN